MATGAEFQVIECGYMHPLGSVPDAGAGEVGYFTASIKNVDRVGDTVTGVENPHLRGAAWLPQGTAHGSVVFIPRMVPSTHLRDALEKLQLNDAALSFEPESSVAPGFGFRCGFLYAAHGDHSETSGTRV